MTLTLKPFQVEDGIYISKRRSALVAHAPRVGKSGISIHACDLVDAKIVVIVCPAAVITNWRVAVEDFRQGIWTAFIVSYNKCGELLRRLRSAKLKLDVLVIDESHYAKSKESARTRYLYGTLCDGRGGMVELAERVYCLTGTPMPNDPIELWPMLRAIAPHLILHTTGRPMTFAQFKVKYTVLVNTPFGMKAVGSRNYKDLKNRLQGFVIRRLRKDVFGREMQPPTKLYVQPTGDLGKEVMALQNSEQGQRVVRALEAGGLKALAKEEANLASLRRLFGLAKVPEIARLIAEELDMESDRKQVIFAYHHAVIDALATALRRFGVLVFDGRTPAARKVRIQDAFRDDPTKRITIGQIQAMSLGLDFSASDDVLFVEQSWVGDENEQAAARIFNMRKDRPCFTRFAILAGSYDEDIVRACDKKLASSRKVFS